MRTCHKPPWKGSNPSFHQWLVASQPREVFQITASCCLQIFQRNFNLNFGFLLLCTVTKVGHMGTSTRCRLLRGLPSYPSILGFFFHSMCSPLLPLPSHRSQAGQCCTQQCEPFCTGCERNRNFLHILAILNQIFYHFQMNQQIIVLDRFLSKQIRTGALSCWKSKSGSLC